MNERSVWFRIGETLVAESKSEITPKQAVEKIREYMRQMEKPEIVRCKDCKHVRKWRDEESAKKFGQIYECARGVFACPKPEDFCSHAERRTDG